MDCYHDESVKIFYKYYYQRFLIKSCVCLVYDPNLDTFYSNCSLFEAYIKIIRGINEEEIKKTLLNIGRLFKYDVSIPKIDNRVKK